MHWRSSLAGLGGDRLAGLAQSLDVEFDRSRMLASVSSRVSPWLRQPGRAGTLAE
jgi:hypothetical protein